MKEGKILSYTELASSPLVATLVFIGIFTVVIICIFFFLLARKESLKLGMKENEVNHLVKTSVIFSLIPSLAIAIGLFALFLLIGRSWALFRLSVVGSITYETIVAKGIIGELSTENLTATDFVNVMFVMSTCIIVGITITVLLGKTLHLSVKKASNKDGRLGAAINSSFFPVLILVFSLQYVIQFVVDLLKGSTIGDSDGFIGLMVLITSIVVTQILKKIKQSTNSNWLADFIMPVSMVIAMASAVLWHSL